MLLSDLRDKKIRTLAGDPLGRVHDVHCDKGRVTALMCGAGSFLERLTARKHGRTIPWESVRKVEAKQTQFLREQEAIRQAELRRQRDEEEARRREEIEREIAKAKEHGRNIVDLDAIPAAPPHPPPAPEPERQVIRGDYGATVSGQKVWVSQVEDYEVAFIAVANNSKVREAIDTAIKAMVRGGVHEIPGVRIWSDVKASNR